MEKYHDPVLFKEVFELLDVVEEEWYVDGTLGDGGYSVEILKKGGKVLGVDVDPQALNRARARFGNFEYKLVQGDFRDLKNLILQADIDSQAVKGVILDLGVSSLQLDSPERGFSFLKMGPLDMRMDPSLSVTAADLVNGLTKGELNELFKKLGEENNAWRFSEAVVRAREIEPFKTTDQLARVIERAAGGRHGKIHPATQVFQALRIAVNDELNALREVMPQALEILNKNGKLLITSFHSLEDRIVKNVFREWEKQGLGIILTQKPIVATEEEVEKNPRQISKTKSLSENMTIIHKFEPDKYEEKPINWRGRRISIFVGLSVMALVIIEIWVSHTVANFGEKFKSIENVKVTLESENRYLHTEIAKLSSTSRIASQSAQLGFNSPKNIKYIR